MPGEHRGREGRCKLRLYKEREGEGERGWREREGKGERRGEREEGREKGREERETCAITVRHESTVTDLLISKRNSGFLIRLTQNLSGRLQQ